MFGQSLNTFIWGIYWVDKINNSSTTIILLEIYSNKSPQTIDTQLIQSKSVANRRHFRIYWLALSKRTAWNTTMKRFDRTNGSGQHLFIFCFFFFFFGFNCRFSKHSKVSSRFRVSSRRTNYRRVIETRGNGKPVDIICQSVVLP